MDDLDDLLDSKFYFCGFLFAFVDLISTIFYHNQGALEEYETVSSTPLNEASTNNNNESQSNSTGLYCFYFVFVFF